MLCWNHTHTLVSDNMMKTVKASSTKVEGGIRTHEGATDYGISSLRPLVQNPSNGGFNGSTQHMQ